MHDISTELQSKPRDHRGFCLAILTMAKGTASFANGSHVDSIPILDHLTVAIIIVNHG